MKKKKKNKLINAVPPLQKRPLTWMRTIARGRKERRVRCSKKLKPTVYVKCVYDKSMGTVKLTKRVSAQLFHGMS